MDYSKWALSRVDELERRVADLSGSEKNSATDSFEVAVDNENEYVSAPFKRIEFPTFCPLENQNITIIVSVKVRYEFDSTYNFSLEVNGEIVKTQKVSGSAGEETNYFAIKTFNSYNTKDVSVAIVIEADEGVFLTILSYCLNVVGSCRADSQQDQNYGKFSADLFDENSRDFEATQQQPAEIVSLRNGDFKGLCASTGIVVEGENPYENSSDIVVHSRLKPSEFVESTGPHASEMESFATSGGEGYLCGEEAPDFVDTSKDSAAVLGNGNVLKTGQKFVFAYCVGNNIYCCSKTEGESLEDLSGSKVSRGTKVAVAFDKLGTPFIARQTQDGKVFVAKLDDLSNELLVCEDVQDFDIVRAPNESEFLLAAVFIKNGQLLARYLAQSNVWSAAETIDCEQPKSVKAVRGSLHRMYLIVSGRRNEILECSPNPFVTDKNYRAAVSVLVY